MKKYICFDIGGTGIKYGILEENGNILLKNDVETEARIHGGKGIIEKLLNLINSHSKEYELSGVAISSHGMIDSNSGIIMHADEHLIPNYTGMNIKQIIENETGLLCEIENDVNCDGLGELWLGSGGNSKYTGMIAIGTGIGACLIDDGNIITGHSMCAGEIGKITIPGGVFEDVASSYALTSNLEKKLGMESGSLNGKLIFEGIESGNKMYIEAVDDMIEKLSIGISTFCYIFNPGTVILGGGIMSRDDYFSPRINENLKKYLKPLIYENTEIKFAKLKNNAGIVGALRNYLNKH
ncbi:ROK family protein [Peptostreptococcus faecalis]|uniref:ROK family protein n=1 Tax=Peptostreptococcus faecalis TaxID=2045015 RepID=UPI000C7C41D2|nr:ROK family protein [Peptostreptococcus faecalis]